jgi:phenylalanine-4-hydroxylase
VLFAPEWGIYDMAVGKKIISAFSGPADVNSFDMITHVPNSKTIKAEKSEKRANLEKLYATVREIREGKSNELVAPIFLQLQTNHPKDWLLCIEIVEILKNTTTDLQQQVIAHLEQLKTDRPEISKLITNGLELILNKTLV